MPATVEITSGTSTATHTIAMRGLAGAIFWCIVAAMVTFLVGFSSPEWHVSGSSKTGVWEQCACSTTRDKTSWQTGVQVTATLGLIGLIICLLSIGVYLFVTTLMINTVLILATVSSFISAFFIFIAVIVFGSNTDTWGGRMDFGFAFTIIAAILITVAGVLATVQLFKSGIFNCCK